jgi:hypothetical protein
MCDENYTGSECNQLLSDIATLSLSITCQESGRQDLNRESTAFATASRLMPCDHHHRLQTHFHMNFYNASNLVQVGATGFEPRKYCFRNRFEDHALRSPTQITDTFSHEL